MSLCGGCAFEHDCLVKTPMNIRGDQVYLGWRCAIFPCPDGMNAAEDALASGTPVKIVVDGQDIDAHPFGTVYKPTDGSYDGVVVRRYITADKRIIVTIPQRGTIFSGLTMERLHQEWRVKR